MHEDSDNQQNSPAELSARLWAIEHVLEHVVIWYWRVRSEAGYGDWLDDAKAHVEGSGLAGVTWAFDQGLEPGADPEAEALVSKHVERLFEHAYRRLERGLRRIGDDPGGPADESP